MRLPGELGSNHFEAIEAEAIAVEQFRGAILGDLRRLAETLGDEREGLVYE